MISEFTIAVDDSTLTDLRKRLLRTRFPSDSFQPDWRYGTSLEYMKEFIAYWLASYDWRDVEHRLNRFPHYLAKIGSDQIHFVYERGSGRAAAPIVITHGWPGSFVEFLSVIEPLAHPERFDGDVDDAFDVIVPSLPGYGWSSAPKQLITTRSVAQLWFHLISEVLEYPTFFAQGGDWGSLVTTWLAVDHPARVPAIHINMAGIRPYDGTDSQPFGPEESDWIARAREQLRRETGYQAIQGTKPQTLAFGLSDSPAGLAAWIVEKFHGWTDPLAPAPPFSLDDLITNVMIYWITNCIHPSTWLYTAARELGGMRLGKGEFVHTPTGLLTTPHDLFPPPPPEYVARSYNCVRRTDLPEGGHFIAFEAGSDFVNDIRDFFRPYRAKATRGPSALNVRGRNLRDKAGERHQFRKHSL